MGANDGVDALAIISLNNGKIYLLDGVSRADADLDLRALRVVSHKSNPAEFSGDALLFRNNMSERFTTSSNCKEN